VEHKGKVLPLSTFKLKVSMYSKTNDVITFTYNTSAATMLGLKLLKEGRMTAGTMRIYGHQGTAGLHCSSGCRAYLKEEPLPYGLFHHTCTTDYGYSGSPIIVGTGNNRLVVGVHLGQDNRNRLNYACVLPWVACRAPSRVETWDKNNGDVRDYDPVTDQTALGNDYEETSYFDSFTGNSYKVLFGKKTKKIFFAPPEAFKDFNDEDNYEDAKYDFFNSTRESHPSEADVLLPSHNVEENEDIVQDFQNKIDSPQWLSYTDSAISSGPLMKLKVCQKESVLPTSGGPESVQGLLQANLRQRKLSKPQLKFAPILQSGQSQSETLELKEPLSLDKPLGISTQVTMVHFTRRQLKFYNRVSQQRVYTQLLRRLTCPEKICLNHLLISYVKQLNQVQTSSQTPVQDFLLFCSAQPMEIFSQRIRSALLL
jgi:hypothetical protein